ncbi:NAD(P)/FAD-dependent oxidoreductase [uncultured Clostridium sp.]|uniref:NAD(P)/FAD-dependent oxidoreductase n=1 Tax=uncultured Clostridium sp. TaxID=59620 RepID=UPI0025F84D0A|nr:NAD(P)/FAD-dependent oxidoreductase [uncultured Clostridium sp.]
MNYANLQKIRNGNRTYSITPHIPGGFVTLETMQKIVDAAKKYNAVLKITSGQRILITNLREEDIPAIWEDLDMEPAVKSTNSVKNIEMCPAGFCKRAKFNTIGIGMKLSKKYTWMEVPCRTKIGVAGCRNACGSVYSKDIGIIADKTGFIVCAGGSGGYNPRVADIIAMELNEEKALKTIDNIFNFYKENGIAGEKLSFFIERIGLDEFKKNVLK